jgi:hypothetical protein
MSETHAPAIRLRMLRAVAVRCEHFAGNTANPIVRARYLKVAGRYRQLAAAKGQGRQRKSGP